MFSIIFMLGCDQTSSSDFKARYICVSSNSSLEYLILPDTYQVITKSMQVRDIIGKMPNGNILVALNKNNEYLSSLCQIDLETNNINNLGVNAEQAYLSPDGTSIAYLIPSENPNLNRSSLYTYDINTGAVVLISDFAYSPVCWSKNSANILYTINKGLITSTIIEIYNLKNHQKEAPNEADSVTAVGWLTDNKVLARQSSGKLPVIKQSFITYELDQNGHAKKGAPFKLKSEFVHDIKEDKLLASETIGNMKYLNVISKSGQKERLVESPLYNDSFGYNSAVYFDAKFISSKDVFYRVLTSENGDIAEVGIYDLYSGVRNRLKNNITNVIGI